jgi:hypothetical protein
MAMFFPELAPVQQSQHQALGADHRQAVLRGDPAITDRPPRRATSHHGRNRSICPEWLLR